MYPLQLLEGDSVSAAGLRQDFSVCHSELHWWALHGSRQRPAGGLTFSVCTQCAGVGQGRGSQGAWTPKAGDDSTELSHPGALWLHSGFKDSPVCCLYLRMEADITDVWGRNLRGYHLLTKLETSSLREEGETCMPAPDRPLRSRQLRDLSTWHLHWLFALGEIQIEPFI